LHGGSCGIGFGQGGDRIHMLLGCSLSSFSESVFRINVSDHESGESKKSGRANRQQSSIFSRFLPRFVALSLTEALVQLICDGIYLCSYCCTAPAPVLPLGVALSVSLTTE
jgi:hypothetical protein